MKTAKIMTEKKEPKKHDAQKRSTFLDNYMTFVKCKN